jgi:hypothetical protein
MNLRDKIERAAALRRSPEPFFDYEPCIGFLANLTGLECDATDDVYAVTHDRELPRARPWPPRLTETDPE